jgi:MoxR-like ATPase
MNQQSDALREKVRYIMNTIQANQLFVHSAVLEIKYPVDDDGDQNVNSSIDTVLIKRRGRAKKSTKSKIVTKTLPEILTICVLNALVPNSAMLLIGGHGGGKTSIVKYLARMFTGISLSEAEECILRAHPQLTEEKVIASLDFPRLMKDGVKQVNWSKFSQCFWKVIDEVNRTSPYTQNILLSLLAEGKIKYYDDVKDVTKYCVYATLNPNDAGTFPLAPPFLDRFGISVPFAMPKSQDLAIILQSHDEKLGGFDEIVQVPKVLTTEQLLSIWYEVGQTPVASEAEDFIHALIREFTLCLRIDKGNSDFLKPSAGLCSGCHFEIPEKIPCCNVDSILSVRVAKDLLRYGKALTWLLGLSEVSIPILSAIAPYVISHRVVYLVRLINKDPYWGSKIEYTRHMLEIVQKRFNTREKAYEIIKQLRLGEMINKESILESITTLETMATNDLIVQQDLLPMAYTLADERYQQMVHDIYDAEQNQNVSKVSTIRYNLLTNFDFPNRGELIQRLNHILRKLTESAYNCTFQVWDLIRFTIDGIFPEFSKVLKETVKERKTFLLRTEDLVLEINVTGTNPTDIVNFNFYGGDSAKKLKDAIEKRHRNMLKSMQELLDEAEKEAQKARNELAQLSPQSKDDAESKEKQSSKEKKTKKIDGSLAELMGLEDENQPNSK